MRRMTPLLIHPLGMTALLIVILNYAPRFSDNPFMEEDELIPRPSHLEPDELTRPESPAQQRKTDLSGYQDHRFGDSRSIVEARLRKEKAVVVEVSQEEIKTKTQVDLANVLLPVSLDKRFSFFRGQLWNVTLQYHENSSLTSSDSVSVTILWQLVGKYGQARQDTTMPAEASIGRFVRWDFPSGHITYWSLLLTESAETKFQGLIGDVITVSYSQNGISEMIEREKRDKTAKEF